jgi:TolA-binding protein
MARLRLLVVTAALVVVGSPWVVGQDAPRSKDPAPKMRGQLPPNWGKLGLSEEQKQKIYSAQTKYRSKIDDLKKQIAELVDQEKKDMEAVLTDAQKSRLREIVSGKAPADGKSDTRPKDKP